MPKMKELTITIEEAHRLEKRGAVFKGATLSQTMGPNWRDIIWLHSPRAPNLSKRCYVCDTHTVTQLEKMIAGLPDVIDVWHVEITKEDNGVVERYIFKSATDVVISGQKTWHHVRGVYKDVQKDVIEFRTHDHRLLLLARRVQGEVKTESVTF